MNKCKTTHRIPTAFALSVLGIAAFALIFTLASCGKTEPTGSKSYFHADSIAGERKEKDAYFREGEGSPLTAEDKRLFQGLTYFLPSEMYCVLARFERFVKADTVTLQSTDSNDPRRMLRVGILHFVLESTITRSKDSCRLTAYRYTGIEAKMQRGYFVPFKDATNGTDSYRPGRYLDIPAASNDAAFVVDFNRAYNPFCNYNEQFSCPIVPQENVLAVKIEAGEKVFFHSRQ
jgi:uncharacterized protein